MIAPLVNAFDTLVSPPKRVFQQSLYRVTVQQVVEPEGEKPKVKETIIECASENQSRRLLEIDYRLEYSKTVFGWTNRDGSTYGWIERLK
jgi:hypothetical protein